jgi:hypothetical protein
MEEEHTEQIVGSTDLVPNGVTDQIINRLMFMQGP